MSPEWIIAVIAIVTLTMSALAWMGRGIWRTFRRTDEFLEDWNGREPKPGHPRQPGVMERLVTLESGNTILLDKAASGERRLDHQDLILETIRAEVTLDHGQSMKDAVQLLLTRFPAP